MAAPARMAGAESEGRNPAWRSKADLQSLPEGGSLSVVGRVGLRGISRRAVAS